MFGYNFDKRYIYAILIILGLSVLVQYSLNDLLGLLYSLPGILIAITFHEYAHALAAVKLGDETPRNQGRLTLNPLSHIDPVGFILLLFAGFGWGKPVQTNPARYDRKIDMSKGEAIVSFAGPAMNFFLAIVFSLVNALVLKYATVGFLMSTVGIIVITILQDIVIVNIGLGIFNLIPLPPLDGSKILKNFLSYNTRRQFEENEQLFYIIFLALWITGLAGTIISPVIEYVYEGITKLIWGIVF